MYKQVAKARLTNKETIFEPYPIDLSLFMQENYYVYDSAGIPCHMQSEGYHPTIVAQYALVQWNLYLTSKEEHHCKKFLVQADWFVAHEVFIGENASGWPISFPHPDLHIQGPYLSALAQGNAISVLIRAHSLTRKEVFLEVARRAVRTFELDILDGGVIAPVGADGIFFQEVATYPAAHMLGGFLFALFGLYDYVAYTEDVQIEKLIHRSLATLDNLLGEFDTGFWIYTNLLHKHLVTPDQFTSLTMLLEVLTVYTGNNYYLTVASQWRGYQRHWVKRLRYQITVHFSHWWKRIQRKLSALPETFPVLRVCVAIASFPVTGGVLTILEAMDHTTKDIWQVEYLTQYVGPNPRKYVIHQFGATEMTSPWYFPSVWLYVLAGLWKLISLLLHRGGYYVVLPQDGFFTGAFAALVAKLVGIRVVCFDHGELNLLIDRNKQINRAERLNAITMKNWPRIVRIAAKQLLVLYWPSRYLLARITAHFADHYLIPGIPGDGIDEVCKQLGVPLSRITRFANMIDLDQHVIPDPLSQASLRQKNGISADAIVISIVCRLAPEKGLEIALAAISQTISDLSSDLLNRVHIIIVGDGPIRQKIENDIHLHGLNQICTMWGEASKEEVIELLTLSDIFLYTSWRGAGYPLAILEAMASECAVIASTEPLANEYMLSEGRGIAVPPGDIAQTSKALVCLLNDSERRHRMGKLARDYIATYHSPSVFKRMLMRGTYWSALEELIQNSFKAEPSGDRKSEG